MISEDEFVPIGKAHLIVGVSRSTVNRWINTRVLQFHEWAEAPHWTTKRYVKVRDLHSAHNLMERRKHAPKIIPKLR